MRTTPLPRSTYAVAFDRRRSRAKSVAGRVPRVARLLALAHKIDERIRSGQLRDLADAARFFGVTRARMSQIMNLTLLAPEIQEAILALPPVVSGRDPVVERTLRRIAAEPSWEQQVAQWSRLSPTCGSHPEHPEC